MRHGELIQHQSVAKYDPLEERLLVGIVIPTLNRSRFIARQLFYYASVGGRVKVYIADSSESEHVDYLREAIRRIGNRLRIVHLKVPGANANEAMVAALRVVEQPYAVYAGDDDFLVPRSIEKCALFLQSNPNYATAHGRAVMVGLETRGMKDRVRWANSYRQRPVECEDGAERLTDFLKEYFTQFSVQPTSAFREDMELVSPVPDQYVGELLSCCLSVVRARPRSSTISRWFEEFMMNDMYSRARPIG